MHLFVINAAVNAKESVYASSFYSTFNLVEVVPKSVAVSTQLDNI